jgi:molybdopterin-guanine dinucleotide biosynthesis protein A
MGEDKAFVKIGGMPLWRRQLSVLQELEPQELFLSGPTREEWTEAECIVIPDARADAGPLGGLVAALQRCSTAHLVTLAVDLPNMTAGYLRGLLTHCGADQGIIPTHEDRFEPVAAVYSRNTRHLAESCLASGDHSLQSFAARCVAEGPAIATEIAAADEPLFLNMNTPEDLLAVING